MMLRLQTPPTCFRLWPAVMSATLSRLVCSLSSSLRRRSPPPSWCERCACGAEGKVSVPESVLQVKVRTDSPWTGHLECV